MAYRPKRKSMNPRKDRKVFSHTAVVGKKANITTNKNGRGGQWM